MTKLIIAYRILRTLFRKSRASETYHTAYCKVHN